MWTWLVEAVFEGMALKKSVFADFGQACKRGAILASKHLDAEHRRNRRSHVAAGSCDRNPLLQFRPINALCLKFVRGKKSSKKLVATCMQLSRKLGKIGVLVRELPRFCW